MFDELYIHPKTKNAVETFIAKPGHALLLIGARGAGKPTLGRHIAAALLGIDVDGLDNYAHFAHIQREKGKKDIPIEAVRNINKSLRLQVPGERKIKRVVLIEDAGFMNTQAQNAFLKSLEEPPADTVFMLTTSAKSELLQTISSRAQAINVHPISPDGLPDQKPETLAAWRLSQGSAGMLHSLLSDESDELKVSVDKAKDFIKMSRYERLIELDGLTKDKEQLDLLLDGLARVIQALYRAAAAKDSRLQVAKLLKAMDQVAQARQGLQANVLPRLIALRLTLNFNI